MQRRVSAIGKAGPRIIAVSHGCVRHDNADIIALYDALKVGDMVAIVDSITDPNLKAPPATPTGTPDLSGAVASRK